MLSPSFKSLFALKSVVHCSDFCHDRQLYSYIDILIPHSAHSHKDNVRSHPHHNHSL